MTGFNLPPGCSVNDLPGNRPFDEFADDFVANHLEDEDLADQFLDDNDDWTTFRDGFVLDTVSEDDLRRDFLAGNSEWVDFLEAKAEDAWNSGDR